MMSPELMLFRRRPDAKPYKPSALERLWLAQQMRFIAKEVGRIGWACIPIQLAHDKAPRCFYTAGFDETLGAPEFVIFDVPSDVAATEFYIAFEGLRQGKLSLEDGMAWPEQDGRIVARKVHPDRLREGWFGLALERRRALKGTDEGLQAYQLVLADRAGVLPWEPGHDEAARQWQPELWAPREDGD